MQKEQCRISLPADDTTVTNSHHVRQPAKRLFGNYGFADLPLDTSRPDSKRQEILEQAMALFGARGYGRTSMRDIAMAVGMLPGSVYYHFASKEALLSAVYEHAIDQAIAALNEAIAAQRDPWDRLEAAAVAHLRLLVTDGALAAVVSERPNQPGFARAELVQQRDRYEVVFRRLIAAVPLPPGVKPGPFRLALLGALNWALTWFRSDGDPPEVVARDLFAVFRANQPHSNQPIIRSAPLQ